MNELGGFWIIGIAVNVILTVLAIVWVFRSMRLPPSDKSPPSSQKPLD